jgi:hypothetical protein
MSCAKVGDLIKFIKDGTFGGKIISKTEDKFILNKKISDGSRHSFVLIKIEGIVWELCNELMPEYAELNGYIGVVIHPGCGVGFRIYNKDTNDTYKINDRHNPNLIKTVLYNLSHYEKLYKIYKIIYIPKCMEQYYTINEYDNSESLKLHVHKYKCDEIKKIRRSDLSIEEQFDKIDEILEKEINIL